MKDKKITIANPEHPDHAKWMDEKAEQYKIPKNKPKPERKNAFRNA